MQNLKCLAEIITKFQSFVKELLNFAQGKIF